MEQPTAYASTLKHHLYFDASVTCCSSKARRFKLQPMGNQDNFEIGEALARLIKRSGRTQKSLAEHMGVSTQGIQGWIKTGSIARENIRPLCEFLDASADELLGLRPVGAAPLSQSQAAGLDFSMLQSALAAVKEAAKASEMLIDDIYKVAPLVAFAYRERAELPAGLTRDEYKAFDITIIAKLKGEIRNGAREGLVAGRGSESVTDFEAGKAKVGRRAIKRER